MYSEELDSRNRWVIKYSPQLEEAFHRRKRPVWVSWHLDETYIRVKGEWKYLYRVVDKTGQTIDFLLTEHRDEKAARCFLVKAIRRHGVPEDIITPVYEACSRLATAFTRHLSYAMLPPTTSRLTGQRTIHVLLLDVLPLTRRQPLLPGCRTKGGGWAMPTCNQIEPSRPDRGWGAIPSPRR